MSPRENRSRNIVNPDMVTLARESRGLTQRDAAGLLGISQARLSKIEHGLVPVPSQLVSTMAESFHYPKSFFMLKDRLWGPGTSEFFHRKRQAASARTLSQLHAQINVAIINISKLLKAVEIERDDIPRIDPDEGFTPAEIALRVRAQWRLPAGPVNSVVGAIEEAGGIVIMRDFGIPLIDATSRYIPGLPRLFFVDSAMPGDRQRLTLAHELGHCIMHQLPHEEMERQAYQFAAEFLMPEKDIKPQFGPVDIPKLASMKPFWKVSMAALLMRARDLGKVSPRMERYLWTQMSKAGYRTKEPPDLDVPREQPKLLSEIIKVHREDLGYSVEEFSKLLSLCDDEVQQQYGIVRTRDEVRSRLRRVV